ncbi:MULTISPECIES: helix-turn-helix transcriptional regulator [Curtobacterium]|uniref:helix-turn-helix transcriptional regulator n=1 Tax=Curtobacterium TaxID=2034 RepID=UPI0034DB2408
MRRSEDLPDWATRDEVAQYTGVAPQTLARWVTEKRGPRVTRFGGRAVRYARTDVLEWIDAQRKASA